MCEEDTMGLTHARNSISHGLRAFEAAYRQDIRELARSLATSAIQIGRSRDEAQVFVREQLMEELVRVIVRCRGTWSGGAGSINNIIESIQADVARDSLGYTSEALARDMVSEVYETADYI